MIYHEEEEPTPYRAKKKNTKKWCRGKVGVKHETETVLWHNWNYVTIEKCKNCGKELNMTVIWKPADLA